MAVFAVPAREHVALIVFEVPLVGFAFPAILLVALLALWMLLPRRERSMNR